MSDILYTLGNTAYLNLTNKCPCRCSFCIRNESDSVGTAESLWLQNDPPFEDVKEAIDSFDFTGFNEIVFCGYGEPLCALEVLIKTAGYIRQTHPELKIRLNTNGLGDLINKKPTAALLKGLVDTVSVSLNAKNPEQYNELCRPAFGDSSYEAMINFAKDCKAYVSEVVFSVVDVISPDDIEACRKIAGDAEIPLRVRSFQ